MDIFAALAFLFGEMLLVAGLAARPAGARVGLCIALLCLVVPAFVQASRFPLVLLAIGFLWCALRAWDLVCEPTPRPFYRRFTHLFALVDTRAVQRVPRRLDTVALVRLIAFSAAVVVTILIQRSADALTGWPHYALRWSAAAVMIITAFEALVALVGIELAAIGWLAPALHDAPHRSLTIAEFWGQRWNRIVGRLLNERAYRPLARRSPWLGVTAAFAVSAAMHAYIIGIALGLPAALAWAAFFMVQPPLLATERWLKVRRWPPAAGWSWTVGLLLLLSPLMTEPGLHLFY